MHFPGGCRNIGGFNDREEEGGSIENGHFALSITYEYEGHISPRKMYKISLIVLDFL